MRKRYKIGFTAGVFDLLHEGHLNILKRAKEYCETLRSVYKELHADHETGAADNK